MLIIDNVYYDAENAEGQQAKSLLPQKRETVDHKVDRRHPSTNTAHSHDYLIEFQHFLR